MIKLPGIIMSAVLASAAYLFGLEYPIIGGPIFGILLGIGVNNLKPISEHMRPGIAFASKKILQGSIVLLGFGLSISQVLKTGVESLAVMLFTMTAAFLTAYLGGKVLGIQKRMLSLIGVGTAVCGGSAIAAVAPIIEAQDDEIAYSISTIFLFNILAVFIFPTIGHLMDMGNYAFGLFAGTAINDTSSVVAAGYNYSKEAGDFATIVKLTRTTLIVPIAFAFSLLVAKQKSRANIDNDNKFSIIKVFPWFVIGFIAASTVNTLGVIPQNFAKILVETGRFSIVIALTAIGLSTDIKKLISTGFRPLLLGFSVWLAVSVVSLLVQSLTGQL